MQLYIPDRSIKNLYHWYFLMLAGLNKYGVKPAGPNPDLTLYVHLSPMAGCRRYQELSLQSLGCKEIIDVNKEYGRDKPVELVIPTLPVGTEMVPQIYCDFNNQPSPSTYSMPAYLFIQKNLFNVILQNNIKLLSFRPKIYLSRKDCGEFHPDQPNYCVRVVINEDQVLTMLRDFGFQYCVPGQIKYEHQLQLFMSASHIIAPHGAALTNLLVCQPDVKLLEFIPNRNNHAHFQHMCHSFNFDHTSYTPDKIVGNYNMQLDIPRLKTTVESWLK